MRRKQLRNWMIKDNAMKKITLLFIILNFSNLVIAQQAVTKEQRKAQQTVIEMFDALSTRDSISLKKYCTTDISFYEYGEIWDLETLINKAITQNKAVDFNRTNTFDFITTTTEKTTASLTYRLASIIKKDGQEVTKQWLETVILSKQKNQWKVKHLHSTLIKKS